MLNARRPNTHGWSGKRNYVGCCLNIMEELNVIMITKWTCIVKSKYVIKWNVWLRVSALTNKNASLNVVTSLNVKVLLIDWTDLKNWMWMFKQKEKKRECMLLNPQFKRHATLCNYKLWLVYFGSHTREITLPPKLCRCWGSTPPEGRRRRCRTQSRTQVYFLALRLKI